MYPIAEFVKAEFVKCQIKLKSELFKLEKLTI
jgi:hypothetical protein